VVHEHVVAIHAVDSWKGMPYLVMPYVAGHSLQERVDREGPLSVKELLRIGMQTAQGLASAHAQGLVHRDVKPSNILLENGVERVKLTDFGLARAVDDASLTQSGVVAGTPQYMSPEQALGEAVDHRSDLFSLWSVLYFMGAGRPPFRANSTPAVLRRVCDERPRALLEVNPDVPGWLAKIVERLHAKDPAGRFQSALEVAEVLGRHLADLQRGTATGALRSTPTSPARPRPRRKTTAALVVLIPAIILVITSSVGPSLLFPFLSSRERQMSADADAALAGIGGDATFPVIGGGSSEAPIIGSGIPAAKIWDIAAFNRVQIRSTFRAEITKADGFKVAASADDNVLPHVRVAKEGTTLKISLEPGRSFQLKSPLKAEIRLPTLVALDLDGASRATLKGFRSEKDLELTVSGASNLDGALGVENADFHVSGASSLTLDGSAKAARLSASGASRLKLGGFLLKQCAIELTGASSSQLTVRSALPFKAKLSGASHLSGSVEAKDVDLELSGASHVTLSGTGKDAKINLNGSSHLKMSDFSLNADRVSLLASGASSVNLQGKAEAAMLEANGVSHLDLAGLVVKAADVKLSGISQAAVDVRGRLNYDLSSGSRLKYLGDPSTVKGTKSGGSTISPRR
jgi:serine/threonine-protein kinase